MLRGAERDALDPYQIHLSLGKVTIVIGGSDSVENDLITADPLGSNLGTVLYREFTRMEQSHPLTYASAINSITYHMVICCKEHMIRIMLCLGAGHKADVPSHLTVMTGIDRPASHSFVCCSARALH